MTVIVIVVLGLWFFASILGQFDGEPVTRLKNHDHYALIPRWTFFAPRPGVTDYHLLFQLHDDESSSSWKEEFLADQRTVWGAIWNPLKRNKKALSDAVRSLGVISSDLSKDELWKIQYTIPYLAVLSYLSERPHRASATHIRFMILESDGFIAKDEPRLLFLSEKHRLR
jgi:hypothetical protein